MQTRLLFSVTCFCFSTFKVVSGMARPEMERRTADRNPGAPNSCRMEVLRQDAWPSGSIIPPCHRHRTIATQTSTVLPPLTHVSTQDAFSSDSVQQQDNPLRDNTGLKCTRKCPPLPSQRALDETCLDMFLAVGFLSNAAQSTMPACHRESRIASVSLAPLFLMLSSLADSLALVPPCPPTVHPIPANPSFLSTNGWISAQAAPACSYPGNKPEPSAPALSSHLRRGSADSYGCASNPLHGGIFSVHTCELSSPRERRLPLPDLLTDSQSSSEDSTSSSSTAVDDPRLEEQAVERVAIQLKTIGDEMNAVFLQRVRIIFPHMLTHLQRHTRCNKTQYVSFEASADAVTCRKSVTCRVASLNFDTIPERSDAVYKNKFYCASYVPFHFLRYIKHTMSSFSSHFLFQNAVPRWQNWRGLYHGLVAFVADTINALYQHGFR
ncbi:hypothetical protein H4Q32_013123 [Labeo rohita]|uniref:Uncharacterized protein n=1 Tax=Labeo rohita TaxID=84645 RepID=A0ABQ8M0X5_LABRO|nr:hypothetical protein H4Q32_013123 [Labeo rohita]